MRFFLLFSGWDDHTDRGNASILGVDPPFEIQNGLERFWKQKKKQAESEAGSSNWPLGNGAILFFPFYSLLLPFYSTCIPSFPGGSDSKVSACNVGDPGLNPGLGRSPGEGNSNPLQYSWLEIPWMEEPGRLQSMGSQSVRNNWAISLSLSFHSLFVCILSRAIIQSVITSQGCKPSLKVLYNSLFSTFHSLV